MVHFFIMGLLLGWGAAIPIGPICLEVIRRNLTSKTSHGIVFGLGACMADVTYIGLLVVGAFMIINHPEVIRVMGFLGAIVLMWFGVSAFRAQPIEAGNSVTNVNKKLSVHAIEGYLMTLINPMTILFWASVSAQLAVMSQAGKAAMIVMAAGVLLATTSWVLFLNGVLHHTHRYIPKSVMRNLNRFGGVLLLVFAGICLYRVV